MVVNLAMVKNVDSELRFKFGENWASFLENFDEQRLEQAKRSLTESLGQSTLSGLRFVDVGAGSGLFSLAASQLGAEVVSFDFDPEAVECVRNLRAMHPGGSWEISEGSVLDEAFLRSLGTFDIVYSWGVLHHTGQMWRAIENLKLLMKDEVKVLIAIYNDQGPTSDVWAQVKRAYNKLPKGSKWMVTLPAAVRLWGPTLVKDTLRGAPAKSWREYSQDRGMSPWHDVLDWVGGYPFEVAQPEAVFNFFHQKGFQLEKIKTCGGGLGCNEYVFSRQ